MADDDTQEYDVEAEEPTEANTPLGDPVDDITPEEHEALNRRGAVLSLVRDLGKKDARALFDSVLEDM